MFSITLDKKVNDKICIYRIVVLQPHGEYRRKMNFVQSHLVQQLASSCQGEGLWGDKTCVCICTKKFR